MTMRTYPYPLKRPEHFLTGNLHPVWELPYEPLGASLPAHQSAHWDAIEGLYYAAWCAREAGELGDREGASDRLCVYAPSVQRSLPRGASRHGREDFTASCDGDRSSPITVAEDTRHTRMG